MNDSMRHSPPSRSLVLTRLLPVGEKGETKAKIQKDLEPLLGHRWSGSVLTEVLDRTLIKLVSKGLVAHRPVKSKKAVPPVELTRRGTPGDPRLPEGQAASHEAQTELGNLKHSLLMAPALGLPGPGGPLSKDDGFRAVLLKKQYGLPLGDYPTLAQAKDGMAAEDAWHGSEGEGHAGDRPGGLAEEGAGRRAPRRLRRRSSIGCWPGSSRTARRHQGAARRGASPLGRQEPGHPGIACLEPPCSAVRSAPLRRPRAGRGPRLSDGPVRRQQGLHRPCLESAPGPPRIPRDGLDRRSRQRLAEANNARLLDLSRADLVQAMDPEDVRLSEVSYLNATFHFIRIDTGKALIDHDARTLPTASTNRSTAMSTEHSNDPRVTAFCSSRSIRPLPRLRLQQRRLEGRSLRCRVDPCRGQATGSSAW